MGKTTVEIEEMLSKSDIIDLNLNERKTKQAYQKYAYQNDELRIYE